MAVTQNTYTGDGTTVLFSFTFPYLENTDIKVSLNGVITTAYTLANATTIQFTTPPANGAAIRIFRVTDDSDLAATFYPGSAIRSQDLNENFTQNLYVTQESNRDATTAISTAEGAVTTANAAVVTANAADATADQAALDAAAAVSTSASAAANASAAVSTANTASSNASSAVSTATAAASDASSAVNTATNALTVSNSAFANANIAIQTAISAVDTAEVAEDAAAAAVATANAASSTATAAASDAAAAVSTADQAALDAAAAVITADLADDKADQAIAAVANALLFDIVANVAAIPATPADGDAVEVSNSTGIESFTPLAGLPSGFVGDSGLGVRLIYDGTNTTWTWLQYFPQDPDNRYAGPNTSAGTVTAPSIAFGPTDPNTGIFSPGADELALVTGGVSRITIDSTGATTFQSPFNAPAATFANGIVLQDDTGTAGVALEAPASLAAPYLLTLPSGVGTAGQILSTDGTGVLSWTNDVGVLVTDGGNFDNGTSTVSTSQTLDGGQF